MQPKISNEAGFSLPGVLMTVALTSGVSLMIGDLTLKSQSIAEKAVKNSELIDLQYFVRQNFACEKHLKSMIAMEALVA